MNNKIKTALMLLSVPATMFLTCAGTIKAENALYSLETTVVENERRTPTTLEKGKTVTVCMLPAIGCAGLLVALILDNATTINNLTASEAAAAVSASIVSNNYNKFKKAVTDVTATRLPDARGQATIDAYKPGTNTWEKEEFNSLSKDVIYISDAYGLTGRCTKLDLVMAQYEANRLFTQNGICSLLNFYQYLPNTVSYDEDVAKRFGWCAEYFDENQLMPWIDVNKYHLDEEISINEYFLEYDWEPICNYLEYPFA